jgi:PKD repeat protein
MQYHRIRLACTALLLVLLPLTVLAAGDESDEIPLPPADPSGGFGYASSVSDASAVADLPAPAPVPREYGDLAWQFPERGNPQPTFAPSNTRHVYVAARDSTITPPGQPLFVCDGVDDELEINAALAEARGGVVELLDGDFRCSGRIGLPERTTLRGQGSLATTVEITAKADGTGYLPISVDGEYVNVGGFAIRGNAFILVKRGHARVQDIRATCIDLDGRWRAASGNGMFFVWVAPPVTEIDDVEFYECHVVNAHTHGFNMNQDYGDGVSRATSNIRFLNCRAVGCGYGVAGDPGITDPTVTSTNQSRSEWITGFDLHEWQDLVNCEVVNCIAADNWESGFHLEPNGRWEDGIGEIGPPSVTTNVVFRDCTSTGNGQRNTYTNHIFMSGYYLSRDTHLYDCNANRNRNAGYDVCNGADCSFTRCTDDGSTCGWQVCRWSTGIGLFDCASRNNPRWALWLSFAELITVENFHQSGVVGDRGYQSMLGWYYDNPNYQKPVTDSSFEIAASGDRSLGIINQEGGGNTYRLSWEADTTPLPTILPTQTPTAGASVAPVVGGSGTPHDPGSDGLYEDVDGNDREDFADVVLYFNQMSWIAANEPVSAFDFNGNGRIDFADVVWLFNHL